MTPLTTPSPPLAIEAVFPELAGLARTTVRLHPRRGHPTALDSSIGGPLLWPSDEAWPECPVPETHDPSEGTDPLPLVPAAQLYARDVPELPFPDGTDLLQVLWCPVEHGDFFVPHPVLFWRKAESIVAPLLEMPEPGPDVDDFYVPRPCVLAPERVLEYPDGWELPDSLRDRIRAWERSPDNPEGWHYFSHLSVAPGSKVAGHVDWHQDPWPATCAQGHLMSHLLTLSDWEMDIEGERRWKPIEERHRHFGDLQCPPDWNIHGGGSLSLFICLDCPDRPVDYMAHR
ncbi:DUF1963 domain-containing protein [Nonomuraea sp. NPDC050663]|uniref:DUF1963 domain-containing protein n=1 Tax=Nonomuraea sp. NPDC050663 TaxID=3364370 RepID=UPI0037A43B3F